jgi:hypothetical protein
MSNGKQLQRYYILNYDYQFGLSRNRSWTFYPGVIYEIHNDSTYYSVSHLEISINAIETFNPRISEVEYN